MIDFKKFDDYFRKWEEKYAEEEMEMRANPNAYYTWEQKYGSWWGDDDWNGADFNNPKPPAIIPKIQKPKKGQMSLF